MGRSTRFSTILFAVALSPAILQSGDCDTPTGNTLLTSLKLELEAGGQNRVLGFVATERSTEVWVPEGIDIVTVRAQSVDPGSTLSLSYLGTTEQFGIGTGEIDVTVSAAPSAIVVLVRAPGGANRAYVMNVTRGVTPLTCIINSDCPSGYNCLVPFPASCVTGKGTCEPFPIACPLVVIPVCGCGGVTYNSPCDLFNAGVRMSADGLCECAVDAECGPSEYCNAVTCDGPGTCTPIPGSCDPGPGDVVACDGLTYDSVCAAAASGQRVGGEIYPFNPLYGPF